MKKSNHLDQQITQISYFHCDKMQNYNLDQLKQLSNDTYFELIKVVLIPCTIRLEELLGLKGLKGSTHNKK